MKRLSWAAGMLPAMWFAFATTAWAGPPDNITEAEIALLPPYCPYTQTFKNGIRKGYHDNVPAERYLEAVGPGFFALHHYCWALIDFQRAARSATPTPERKTYWLSAYNNLKFVVENSPPDMVLLPEIYTWMGRAGVKLKDYKAAEVAFEKAWTLKADYWPPYYHWAEALRAAGKRAEARSVVEAGLKSSPDAKALKVLGKELGVSG